MVAGICFVDWDSGENTALYAKQCSRRCSLIAAGVKGNENWRVSGQQRPKRELLEISNSESTYSF
jgi:hypothetical protein